MTPASSNPASTDIILAIDLGKFKWSETVSDTNAINLSGDHS
jgi:hypothetical protein